MYKLSKKEKRHVNCLSKEDVACLLLFEKY